MENNMSEERTSNVPKIEKIVVIDDLFKNCKSMDAVGLIAAAVIGCVESFVSPLTYKKLYKQLDFDLSHNPVSTYNLAHLGTEALLYTVLVGSHIERIVRNPEDWKNWIPAATNVGAFALKKAYQKFETVTRDY